MALHRDTIEAEEARYTKWFNPLETPQSVVIHLEGKLRRKYVVPAGGTLDIPSEYDRAIHMVICSIPECRNSGGLCKGGHDGNIMGGLAPLLVNMSTKAKMNLHDALDPSLAIKKQHEADLASAIIQKSAIDQSIVIAAAKMAAKAEQAAAPKK